MSAYALPDLFHTPSDHFSFNDEKQGDAESVRITVNDAKIDSVLLIHSLLGSRKQTPTSSSHIKRRSRTGGDSSPSAPSCREALKFELSISFNGRKYTALRSLPSFEKLRRDLQEEVDDEIPELRFEEAIQGHSFSFLHVILQSYIPTVESWLREVTDRVSPADSISLRSFLWEPFTSLECLNSDSSCSSQLDRIDETEADESEDELSL